MKEYINSIRINDTTYSIQGATNQDELFYQVWSETQPIKNDVRDHDYRIVELEANFSDMALAVKKIQASVEELTYSIATHLAETIVAPNEKSPGDFWTEIEENNMFLRNLK